MYATEMQFPLIFSLEFKYVLAMLLKESARKAICSENFGVRCKII